MLRPTDQQLKEAVESFDANTGYLESDIDQPAAEPASSSAAPKPAAAAPKAGGRVGAVAEAKPSQSPQRPNPFQSAGARVVVRTWILIFQPKQILS